MATTTYPNKLIAGSNLGLADANDIVYSTKEVSAGDGETVAIKDKSVKDKLDEIENKIDNIEIDGLSAENIAYSEDKSIKDVLDDIGDILEAKTQASLSAILASAYTSLSQSAYTNSQSFVNQLSQVKDEALNTINNKTSDVMHRLDTTEAGIANLNELASLFNAALSVNTEDELDEDGLPIAVTKFAIVSENQYNVIRENNTLNENTLYFCYDPSALDLPDTAYSVSLSVNDSLFGNVVGSGSYAEGADVTIKAYPAVGYLFNGWKNNISDSTYVSTNSIYEISGINDNISLVAEFSKDASKYNVFIASSDYAGGNVHFLGMDNSIYFRTINAGTTITVVAEEPNSGYVFSHWRVNDTDLLENTGSVYQITPNNNVLIVGVYKEINTIQVSANILPLKINDDDPIPGTVSGVGTLTKGQTVLLYAKPNDGFTFVNWTYDGTTSTENPLIIDNRLLDLTVNAQFLASE